MSDYVSREKRNEAGLELPPSLPSPYGVTGGVPGPDTSMRRVLLVDDHSDMLTMMNLMMTQRSYRVATASSGQEALTLVDDFEPHVVVSDITMPDMDGYEMMATARRHCRHTGFKSIALSGHTMDDAQERSKEAGFDVHLPKPVDFDNLFQILDDLVRDIEAQSP